jgi:hypothetical protein
MVEAERIVTQVPAPNHAQRLAQRQAIAVRVLCERRAQEEIKDQIRRQGKIKLSKVPRHHIERLARDRLFEDGEYRARLIAEARPIVDRQRRDFSANAQRRLCITRKICTSREALSRGHFCCAKLMIEMELRDDSRLCQGEH